MTAIRRLVPFLKWPPGNIMKPPLHVLFILLYSFSFGAETEKMQADAFGRDNLQYPSGSIFGLGGSMFTYQTNWTAIRLGDLAINPLALNPEHIHNKLEVMAFLENRSMFNMGSIHMDVRGEIRFGISGESKQNYIPDSIQVNDIISETGTNWSGGAHFKFAYPFDLTPRVHLAPFVGAGVTFVLLEQASGDNLDKKYSNELSDLSYEAGWNEFSLYTPLNVGLNLDFETWSIIPEYRRSFWGRTFTSWAPPTLAPDGNPSNNTPGFPIKSTNQIYQGFALSLAFRIGR